MVRNVASTGVLLAVLCVTGAGLSAQDATAPASTTTSTTTGTSNAIVNGPGTPQPTAGTPAAQPRRRRAISADVAAQLSAAVPKFTPPPPKPPPSDEEQPDLREVDQPRNGIIRLPKYIVREPRPAVLSERAVTTKGGLADLAKKRYLSEGYRSLNRFTLPLFGTSPEKRAMAMYEEDERLQNMASVNEDARLVGSTDSEQGRYVKKLANETFARPGDFDWKPIGR